MDGLTLRTDADLLKASATDAEAFGLFYDRHVGRIGSFFVRTADHSIAAELTAETFAEAFASRRRYRKTTKPATAWLHTIAFRQLNEFHRKQRVANKYRHRLGIETREVEDSFDRVDDLDELRSRLPALTAALAELTTPAAEAVRLRVGEGWSYERLGTHLGCTPGAARVRVSRALARLEQRLTETGIEES